MSSKERRFARIQDTVILAIEVPSSSLGSIYKKCPRRHSQYT
jgi:hypothetical protein